MLGGDISIVDVVVAGAALVCSLPILGAFNILDVHDVADGLCGGWLRASACDVIDLHLVADELVGVGFNVVKALQFVDWVERVLRLVGPAGFELIHARLASLDVLVCEVELWLVELEVEHARASTQHVESVMEIGSICVFGCPNPGLRPYKQFKSFVCVPWMSLLLRLSLQSRALSL